MNTLKTTPLYSKHQEAGARLVEFSGWNMPVQYPTGILQEHLATRRNGGIFDVSHMGRFKITGKEALPFLSSVLTNDPALLAPGSSQYTIIPSATGGAIDDAYLCHWTAGEFILIVNAGNLAKDWAHLQEKSRGFDMLMEDLSPSTVMIAVQGPDSARVTETLLQGPLPGEKRNCLSSMEFKGQPVYVSRTGYTGEPVGYELILPAGNAAELWDALLGTGLVPVGLGARDTLRLEAGLPLYGHEFGLAPDGSEIPIFSCPLAKFAVKLSPERPDFIGRKALEEQLNVPPERKIIPFLISGKGIARAGCEVLHRGQPVGWVTSGTMVPYLENPGDPESPSGQRALGLALVSRAVEIGDALEFSVRRKLLSGLAVKTHLENRQPPYAIPVLP